MSEITSIYDEESGLGVEWVRDEPPMERRTHFRLWIKGREVPFSAWYEFGSDRLHRRLRAEGVSVAEIIKMTPSEDTMFYEAQNINAVFDRDKFLELWQRVLSKRHSYSVGVRYLEGNPPGEPWREWTRGV